MEINDTTSANLWVLGFPCWLGQHIRVPSALSEAAVPFQQSPLSCRELKFCEVRWITFVCRRPCPAALAAQSPGVCSAGPVQGEDAVPWPGASAALKEQSCFSGGRDGLSHEDGECSCLNDHTVLSSGSLLARLPLALGVASLPPLSSSWAQWFFQPPRSSSGCMTLK